MSDSAERYHAILDELAAHGAKASHGNKAAVLVAVSKTFPVEKIEPVIKAGCRIFGENRVQEAQEKWPALKARSPDIELHLIGPLQSNKAGDAVALFDVIQTVDRKKIATALAREIKKQNREPRLFVQVNTGSEAQKAGVLPEETVSFVKWCQEDVGLKIEGLMALPPLNENPGPHFSLLGKLGSEAGLSGLSMGMSGDYLTAIEFGASHVRIGSAIFGER